MNNIKSKIIIDKMIRYVINCVLLSQLEYLTTNFISNNYWIGKIDKKIRTAIRGKLGLSKVFPSIGINRELGYKVFSLKE